MEHSKVFPFSSAHRWSQCHGSPKMCKDEPDTADETALEGETAHWVAQQMLETFKLGGDGPAIGVTLIGMQAPTGMIITEEMYDGALVYYNQIVRVVGEHRDELHIEVRVHAHHTLDPEAWGTADAIYYDPSTNTLYVWDFKFGHYSVEAYDNWQLVCYALAACETFKFDKINPRLNLNIIQPRCYDGKGPVRNWITVLDDLRAHVNIMKAAITEHRMNKGKVTSGDWCRECLARHKCPAIRQAAAVSIDYSTQAIPLDMSNEALAYELEIIERAEARMKQRRAAIETEAESRVRAGQLVPGRRMEDTIGQRKWSQPDNHIFMLGETLGVDFHQPDKPVSPNAAETILRKNGVDESVIKAYYHKPHTGLKLIADDGTRAKRIFSQEKI